VGKAITLGANAKFFGQKPAAKNEKIKFVSIKRKKQNSFHPVRRSARNPRFLLVIIIAWGELGKAILQVSKAGFSGAVKIFLGQRWLGPLEIMARTPMQRITSYVRTSRCLCLR